MASSTYSCIKCQKLINLSIIIQIITLIAGTVSITYGVILNSSILIIVGQLMAGIPCMSLCFTWVIASYYNGSHTTNIAVVVPYEQENPINIITVQTIIKNKPESDPTNIV